MEIEEQYRRIIAELRRGGQPRWKPQEEDLVHMENMWQKCLDSPATGKNLIPIFCLLSHTHLLTERFDALLVKTLSLPSVTPEVLISGLGCFQRQVADRCERRGDRFPQSMVECLRGLLTHPDSEVFYWCLLGIERMGTMGLILRADVIKNCPGWWPSLFNHYSRASRKMVILLNRQWAQSRHS